MKSKRAQEEMVGFVLIVVLVAVIFLVFLGIFVRRAPENTQQNSAEVSQFLSASLEYTTNCTLDGGFSFKSLADLTHSCNLGLRCDSGKTACEELKETSRKLVETAWTFSDDSPTVNYKFSIDLETAQDIAFEYSGTESDCTLVRGAERPISGATFSLELCLN